MAVIDFNEGLIEVIRMIPEERNELPAKRIFDTLMRSAIEKYFDIHEEVTNLSALWESFGVNPKDKWVRDIEDYVINGFFDTMEEHEKKRDYNFEMRYKDGYLTIPYLNKDPRCTPGFKLKGKIQLGALVELTRQHLSFDKHLDESNYLDIAISMFTHHFKSTLMGFITPSEHPLETYYEKHQLVEVAYSINNDPTERYEDDTVEDLINFVFSEYFESVDVLMAMIYETLEITPSSVVEIYKKDSFFYIYKSTESIEEIVFRQVFDLGTCSIKDAESIEEKDYCHCYL